MVSSSLDAESRRTLLNALLEQDGAVVLTHAAETYGVSEMTIRRDLSDMEREGLVRRVRGGAVAVSPELFQRRQQAGATAKQLIASKLVPLTPTKGAVALDASTTIHWYAQMLPANALTVVTSGLETFGVLKGRPGIRACITGGEVETLTGSLVGPLAQRTVRQFVFARAFLSASGLHSDLGATEATIDGAEFKRTVLSVSRSVVLAVDSTKLEQTGAALALRLDEIDVLVTDLAPGDQSLDPFRDRMEIL